MKTKFTILCLSALAAPGYSQTAPPAALPIETEADRMPKVHTGGNCIIRHGRVIPVHGAPIDDCDILVTKGKIVRIGKGLDAPAGYTVIDAAGKIVTPGIIDAHSHRGEADTNEWTDSIVAETQIRDVLNPDQEGLWYDVAAGITSGLTLHGSSDSIGGQSIVIKHKWHRNPQEIVFHDAPRMIKFALGENVTQKNNGSQTRFPQSRMGVEATMRRGFDDAKAYKKMWADYKAHPSGLPPRRDLRLETLADILDRKIWVQCHSYKQSEMLMLVRLSQEYGFKIGAMQHALESYKIAPELAEGHIPVSMFSSAWAYKLEVIDAIPMGVAICLQAGVLASINTDTFSGMPPLLQDAAKQMRYGISEADALKTVTLNPAKQLGIDKYAGTLEEGKDADIAIWDGHPLSIYSRCAMTLVDGEVEFARRDAFGVNKLSTLRYSVKPSNLTADLKPLPQWSNTYAIVGGTVHMVSGPEITDGRVIIKGEKIVAVGGNTLDIPRDATVIDAKGKQVYPGLIAVGTNLGLNEMGLVQQSVDDHEGGPFNADLDTLIAFNPDSIKVPIARSWGITSAYILHGGPMIAGQGSVVDLAGYNREQMAISKKSALEVNMPSPPPPAAKEFMPPEAYEKQVGEVKERRLAIRDQFELAQAYWESRKAGGVATDSRYEAYIPYLQGAKPVFIHADSEDAIKEVLSLGKQFKLKVVIVGGAEAWKVTKELVAADVPVVYGAPAITNPSGTVQPASEMDPYDSPLVAPTLMRRDGVKFCIAGGESSDVQDLAWRAGWLCAYGLPHDAAIRAITLDAAKIAGVGDQVGSLEPGKRANIMITDGDPLEFTTQVENVFIGGKPVSLSNHFTQLYRKFLRRIK